MTAVVWVIVDVVYHGAWAASLTAIVAATFVALWYVVPVTLMLRQRKSRARADPDGS